MELQRRISAFYQARPLMRDHDTPQNIIDLLRGEVDEVEGEIKDPVDVNKMAYELSDVVIYAMCMAEVFGIDLANAVVNKLAINERRFPVHLFDYSSGDDFDSIYMARKRELGERE